MYSDQAQVTVFFPNWLVSLVVLVICWAGLANAQSVSERPEFKGSKQVSHELVVAEQTRQVSLGRYLRVFEDPSGQVKIDDLLQPNNPFPWQPNTLDIPNFGYSNSSFWFALQIRNASVGPLQKILEIGYPLLDKISIYQGQLVNGELVVSNKVHVLGDTLPFSQRIISHRNFLIPLDIPASSTLRYYFKLEGGSAKQLPLSLWDENALFEVEQSILIYFGICFGGLLIMLIYNLFLFFSLGDRSYLYLVFTLFFFLVVHASFRGLSYQFLWPEWPVIQGLAVPLSVCWGMASLAALSIVFLNLRVHESLLYRALSWVMYLLLVSGILVFFLDNKTSTQLAVALTIAYGVLGLIASVRSWLKGFTPAFLFTLAYTLIFLGTLVLSFNKFGILPRNLITEYGQEFGFLLEAMILAAALANKISILRRAKEKAEKETKASLEEKVLERTKEVNHALDRLELSNHKLSRMSREDGLTHLLNRRAFDEMLDTEWKRAQRSRSSLALILADIDFFKTINDHFGHLAGDDCLRQMSMRLKKNINRPGDVLFRFGGEEFALLLPETDLEGALIVAERMREVVAGQKLSLDDFEQNISMSFGVAAAVPTSTLNCQDLIFGADQALYRAKDNGRNRVELTNSVEEHSF